MRLQRGPTCLDEPSGGADGREIGRQGELQRQLDEISADKRVDPGARAHPTRAGSQDASAELWAEAEAICERNGLPSTPSATRPPAGASAMGEPSHRLAGGEPATAPIRSCSRCGHEMNSAATRCGYCWLRVAPMGADGVEPPPLPLPRRPWWRF